MTRVKPGQRKRAKAPKVRTGCQTCKTRRIKCDETRPFCLRCTSTGRQCDGFTAQATLSPPMPLSTYPTPSSEDEFRAVQFFRERTLAQVSKFFVDELWTTKILQIAHAEPGIWHALISLSSYHELFMKPADSTNNQLVMERHNLGIYALHHHNMAIKAALDIQRTPKHPLSHLISCVVFVTIEMIRGEVIAAIRLLKYGHRVLQEFEAQHRNPNITLGAEEDAIVNLVEAFFTRLAHQAICLVGARDPEMIIVAKALFRSRRCAIDSAFIFTSLLDAREALIRISLGLLSLPLGLVAERFRAWCSTFDKFCFENQSQLSGLREMRTLKLLGVYKKYMEVELQVRAVSSLDDPSVWDSYCPDFSAMVDKLRQILAMDHAEPGESHHIPEPHFQMEVGVIAALYGTIIRCRDPMIRRRALATLESSDIQEGLWNSKRGSAISRRVMELEEQGQHISTCGDIPKEARIIKVIPRSGIENDDSVYFQFLHGWKRETFSQLDKALVW